MQKPLSEKTNHRLPLAAAHDHGFGMAIIAKCEIHVNLVSTDAYKMCK